MTIKTNRALYMKNDDKNRYIHMHSTMVQGWMLSYVMENGDETNWLKVFTLLKHNSENSQTPFFIKAC